MEIQNEYVIIILEIIYKSLKKGKDHVSEAVEFMNDMGINNDQVKEHLMGLCMDPQIIEQLEKLDT